MAIREAPANNVNRVVRIAEKIKATKFSGGPEYKFVFKLESATNQSWRAFFTEKEKRATGLFISTEQSLILFATHLR